MMIVNNSSRYQGGVIQGWFCWPEGQREQWKIRFKQQQVNNSINNGKTCSLIFAGQWWRAMCPGPPTWRLPSCFCRATVERYLYQFSETDPIQSHHASLRIYTKYWENNDSQVYTGKFHPSGDILASSGFDRQIFLWKVYGEHQFYIELDSSFVFVRNHSNWACIVFSQTLKKYSASVKVLN